MGMSTLETELSFFFISSFGIYGAVVVPDCGVGNTWQERLAIILKQGVFNRVAALPIP